MILARLKLVLLVLHVSIESVRKRFVDKIHKSRTNSSLFCRGLHVRLCDGLSMMVGDT